MCGTFDCSELMKAWPTSPTPAGFFATPREIYFRIRARRRRRRNGRRNREGCQRRGDEKTDGQQRSADHTDHPIYRA
jgi:hypothetical protein